MNREPAIKSLNEILKMGYLPSRGRELYGRYTCRANCLFHSAFNLTNELLDVFDEKTLKHGISAYDYYFSNLFGGFNEYDLKTEKERIYNFIRETGLKVDLEKHGEILKHNQYKIAFYATDNFDDNVMGHAGFHFMLQEKDGSWSSKNGNDEVEFDVKLENTIPFHFYSKYLLQDVLVITNPYAQTNQIKELPVGTRLVETKEEGLRL